MSGRGGPTGTWRAAADGAPGGSPARVTVPAAGRGPQRCRYGRHSMTTSPVPTLGERQARVTVPAAGRSGADTGGAP